jgi:hypothetical protein
MFPVKKKKTRLALGFAALALSITPESRAVGGVDLQVTKFALEKGVFNAIFAKELCSCQFVDGLSLDECKERDNLPGVAHAIVNISVDPQTKSVTSAYRGHDTIAQVTASLGLGEVTVGGSATARMDDAHPEYGCVLTKLPEDP